MKINKEKMDKGEITDEHISRVSVSNKPKLSRKEQQKVARKDWKIRNAAGKKNAHNQKCENLCSNDRREPTTALLQRSSLDKSIEKEMFTENTREDAKIRNCDKNHNLQSVTSSSNSVKKSSYSGNYNETQEDISKTSEVSFLV